MSVVNTNGQTNVVNMMRYLMLKSKHCRKLRMTPLHEIVFDKKLLQSLQHYTCFG